MSSCLGSRLKKNPWLKTSKKHKRCLPVHKEFTKVAQVCSSKKLCATDIPSIEPTLIYYAKVAEIALLMAPTLFDKDSVLEAPALLASAKTLGDKTREAAHAQHTRTRTRARTCTIRCVMQTQTHVRY